VSKGLTRITGLWEKEDKNGNNYLCGQLNAISRVMVMPNTFKRNEHQDPYYFLYFASVEKEKPKDKTQKKDSKQKELFNQQCDRVTE